jgi:tetratricopeptide (TPR) repeat protein
MFVILSSFLIAMSQSTKFAKIDGDRENVIASIRNSLADLANAEAVNYGLSCVLKISNYMWKRGLWREWAPDVTHATEVAMLRGDYDVAATLLAYRAGLHQALGEWKQAMDLARTALANSKTANSRREALFRVGCVAHDLGQSRLSRTSLEEALSLAVKLSDQIAIKHRLYRAYRALGHLLLAQEFFKEVLAWTLQAGDDWLRAELLLDKAADLRHADPIVAMGLVKESLALYTELSFDRGAAYAELEFGRIASTLGQVDAARSALCRARVAFDRMRYDPGLAHVFHALAEIELRTGEFGAACRSLEASIEHARRVGYVSAQVRSEVRLCVASLRRYRFIKFISHLVPTLYLLIKTRPSIASLRRIFVFSR